MPKDSTAVKHSIESSTCCKTSTSEDGLSWLVELPLELKVHIIMCVARAANRPVLGMAVNKLCRKTMVQQQPDLTLRAVNLPSAMHLLLNPDLKGRLQPMNLEIISEYWLQRPALPSPLPKTTSNYSIVVTKLTLGHISQDIQQGDLQHFPMLTHLNVIDCGFGAINFAVLANLISFSCKSCKFMNLMMSGHAALTTIKLIWSKITTGINIHGCMHLEDVCIWASEVGDILKIQGCNQLRELDCSSSAMSALEISQCNQLSKLHCANSNMANESDIGHLQTLKQLSCRKCHWLQDLHVPPSLVILDCAECEKLMTINAAGCSALEQLNCNGCQKLLTLDVTSCRQLRKLNCGNCASLPILDLSGTPQLARLVCHGCDTSLQVVNLPASLLSLHCFQCIDIPKLLKNVPSGLRCLGIQYTATWRDLLHACPALKLLRLHSCYYSNQLKAGATLVILGAGLKSSCQCDICTDRIPGSDEDEDDEPS